MRVVMYVRNDVRRDSRVLREARTLAAAGHQVTVVALASGGVEEREERDGFAIVRLPAPSGRPLWTVWLGRPWRLFPYVVTRIRAARLDAPRSVGRAALSALAALATLPWLGLRALGSGLARLASRGRPLPRGVRRWDDYLGWWLGSVAGWQRLAVAAAPPADVHHAHDFDALPAAAAAARRDRSRYVYDSHELFTDWRPNALQPWWLRLAIGLRERQLARGAAAVVTVNDEIARILTARFRIRPPAVLYNCPPRPTSDRVAPLRETAGVPPEVPLAIYHGAFVPDRGLAEIAAALREPGLEALHVVFLGYGPLRDWLADLAGDPAFGGRLHLLDPVPPEDVPAWVAGADVAVMPIGPQTRNLVLSTPNKLFESLAAGVPVVASDFPGMRRIVLGDPLGPLGAVCDPTDPASIARAIRSILALPPAERAALRSRCRQAALERWNWETEGAKLVALYERLGREARR